MKMRGPGKTLPLSRRLYGALLAAYPPEFRREFGREMALVFNDRCRDAGRQGGARALALVWCEALVDLALTAPRERAAALAGGGFMRVLRTVVLALAAYAFALLVAAPLYMRNRESMHPFLGNMADALIATGVLFNVIFLILTLPRLAEGVRAVRLAGLLTSLIVAGLIAFIAMTGGPPARPHLSVIAAQVLALFLWYAAHLWWVLRPRGAAGPPEPA